MSRYKKWILGAVVFFVLFTIIGFFAIPPVVKPYLLEILSKTLNRQVSRAMAPPGQQARRETAAVLP